MRIVDNSPMWAKALAAPVIVFLCFLAAGTSAFVTLQRSVRELTVLAKIELPKQTTMSELTYNIIMTHVQAARYVSWANNAVGHDKLEELGRDVTGGLDMWRDRLKSFRERETLSVVEQGTFEELMQRWRRYHEVVEDAIEAGATDAPRASELLALADDEFKSLAHQLLVLSAVADNQTRLTSNDLVHAAQANMRLLVLGGLAGALISILMTVFVARSIVAPIGTVTRAMQRISSGSTEDPIRFGDRTDEIGRMVSAIAVFRENMERQNKLLADRQGELRAQNLRFDAALNHMSQGLAMFDAEHRLVVCNTLYADLYGMSAEQVRPGTTIRQLLEYRHAKGLFGDVDFEAFASGWLAEFTKASSRIQELSDGRIISIVRRPMLDGGVVSTTEDITDRCRSEAKIAHMARHDALTDLPNRVLLKERLELALARAERGELLATHLLDLDHFKNVNDTLGHPAGDKLLRMAVERLNRLIRPTDTIARMGGDEFAVLQVGLSQPSDATPLAQRIIEVLSEPYDIDGQQVVIGTSVGIALGPADGQSPDQLIRNADLALYRAKADGRGTYRFFESDMDAQMQARRVLEQDLRKAFAVGEFELHYQPIVNVTRSDVIGFEALIRWRHPEKGMIPPSAFIPLAEEIGLIVPLGEWILRTACSTATTWPGNLRVAVNLSPAQFRSPGLTQAVIAALDATGLSPDRLELEITETVLFEDKEATLAVLYRLRELGVGIAMDDFGTGYSSLSYLQSFPFDRIKIDQSFVKDINENESSRNIVRAVAALAKGLGMISTAEGVETKAQLDTVKAEGCTEVQGFYFSRARPAHELAHVSIVEEHQRRFRNQASAA
jgi:diguanylate cyclase (GGDEF)-like protein